MGAAQSAPATAPSTTLETIRAPIADGASGLHYSGAVYTNQVQQLSKDLCNGATVSIDHIADVMPDGISSASLPLDATTQRISSSALQGYISELESRGLIPGQQGSFDQQMQADKAFYAAIQTEYCYYEARYVAAMTQFLALVSNPNGTDQNGVSGVLQSTQALNQRLNSLLEILNYVGNERARNVNVRGPEIDAANQQLDDRLARLAAQKEFLSSNDVRLKTQVEMIRYSAEKSHAMNIQIMFFVALNVVALGTVLTVYKSTAGA